MFFSEKHLEAFRTHAARCNNVLNGVHEGCSPYNTSKERSKWGIDDEYGGITGTIVPKDILRVARVLVTGKTDEQPGKSPELGAEYRLRHGESIFCDIGCGTGRPSSYFASLGLRCSMGFDVDSLQVLNSMAGYNKLLQQRVGFNCPVTFFKQDALALETLDPVTHVYSFIGKSLRPCRRIVNELTIRLGYPNFAYAVARLVAETKTLKVLVAVVLRTAELIETGLIECMFEHDVIVLPGMRMSAGNSYLGFVIPINEERRRRVKQTLRALIQNRFNKVDQEAEKSGREMFTCATSNRKHSLTAEVYAALALGPNKALQLGDDPSDRRRPLRACRRTLLNEPENDESSSQTERIIKRERLATISPSKRSRRSGDSS